MSETAAPSGAPILTVSGTLTEKDYAASMRSRLAPRVARMCLVYVLLVVLLFPGVFLVDNWEALTSGAMSLGECLGFAWEAFAGDALMPLLLAGFCALYVFIALWYTPRRLAARFRERYPDGARMIYRFWEDRLETTVEADAEQGVVRMDYADVQRKIRENKHCFVLSTLTRNTASLHKCLMTAEEITRVGALLRERCPQRRTA